jgi:electron transport complex protein RnfA
MAMLKELLLIILASALANNLFLEYFMGLSPLVETTKKVKTAAGMGVAVLCVTTISSAIIGAINYFAIKPLNLAFLQTLIVVLVVVAVVRLLALMLKNILPASEEYLTLITANSAVLGVVLLNMQADFDILTSTVNGFGAALGFMLVLLIMAGIREKIAYNDIPESFQGIPILLVTAGLIALAFSGFAVLF